MDDYVYISNDAQYNEPTSNHNCVPEVQASTTLEELDEIEIINRHSDEFNKIPNTDNPYPDVLKKPIFTKTISETTPSTTITKPYNIQKIDFKDMSIQQFSSTIANSLIEIIHDILNYKSGDNFTDIFTKDSRILAIGVLLLIISIFFIFFKNVE